MTLLGPALLLLRKRPEHWTEVAAPPNPPTRGTNITWDHALLTAGTFGVGGIQKGGSASLKQALFLLKTQLR